MGWMFGKTERPSLETRNGSCEKQKEIYNKEESSFRKKFIKDILYTVETYKDHMPEGYEALLQRKAGRVTDILLFFIEFFEEEFQMLELRETQDMLFVESA